MALVFASTGAQPCVKMTSGPVVFADRLVEELLTVSGRHELRLHLHPVLHETLRDRQVRVAVHRVEGGIGTGVLDAQDQGTDVGAPEVDRRVRVHGLEAGCRRRVLAIRLGCRGGRRRDPVAQRRHLRGSERLGDLRSDVVADSLHRRRVAERRDHLLVAGGAVVGPVEPPTDQRHVVIEQPTVGEERERRVVDDHEHVLVLHEVLRRGEVCPRGLIVDVLDVELATAHPTLAFSRPTRALQPTSESPDVAEATPVFE